MKKKAIILMVVLASLALCTTGFAATNEDDPGSAFTVNDGDGNNLTFNFSPSVAGQYLTAGSTGNEQAFTIGAYHEGGSLFYGTASTETTIYKKDRDTNQTFASAGFPETTTTENADGSTTSTTTGSNSPWTVEGSEWDK